MSLVLRPEVPARFAARVTQTAAVGVAKALWGFGVEARIKWPNDLLVLKPGEPEGRKICGILAEFSAENLFVAATRAGLVSADSRLDFVVLGVGLNANFDPEDLNVADRGVATIRSELGHDVDVDAPDRARDDDGEDQRQAIPQRPQRAERGHRRPTGRGASAHRQAHSSVSLKR